MKTAPANKQRYVSAETKEIVLDEALLSRSNNFHAYQSVAIIFLTWAPHFPHTSLVLRGDLKNMSSYELFETLKVLN